MILGQEGFIEQDIKSTKLFENLKHTRASKGHVSRTYKEFDEQAT